jgi:protein ImuB
MIEPKELYACLYVKEFPAQALLRLRPELHGKPCVVMQGEPPMQTVCSRNTKARLLHVAHGMTRVEVDTFPNLVVLSRSRDAERSTKAILLECAGAFSPRAEDRSEESAFLCGIDIAGTQSLFGPPEMLARSLVQRVRAVGIAARVTVSSNFYAAICLAKGLPSSTVVQVVVPGEEAMALASLPIAVLDPTEMQAETFALWGIHTLGMLAALPEEELISRMGQDGKRLRQLARGERPHLFQPVEPAFTLAEKIELDSPVELLESRGFFGWGNAGPADSAGQGAHSGAGLGHHCVDAGWRRRAYTNGPAGAAQHRQAALDQVAASRPRSASAASGHSRGRAGRGAGQYQQGAAWPLLPAAS